jgi:imidazolonepropionase-like amidohydrolase
VRAAVEVAANWGTYVAVHVYSVAGIRLALAAGVRSIEHGHLADEATAQLMAEHDVWWSLQPFLDDEDSNTQVNPVSRQKQIRVHAGTETAYALAKKYQIKTAFGTDILFDARRAARQGAQLAKLARWYTPAEVLRMATADNGQCLALSGPCSPYAGKLGVVEEGALADLLLVDGDPLANINLIADPERNFLVIMKDGQVVKNQAR